MADEESTAAATELHSNKIGSAGSQMQGEDKDGPTMGNEEPTAAALEPHSNKIGDPESRTQGEDEDRQGPAAATATEPERAALVPPGKRNLNSYYGHRIGFLQTLSLVLNAGLMVYAHLGLSAVILSSQDPTITANANADTNAGIENGDGGNAGEAVPVNETAGMCNARDAEIWTANGGEESRPERSDYCSREYNGGCFLDRNCIETCFREEYGYTQECSSCFASIPGCSVGSGCMMDCASDSFSEACQKCNAPCIEELGACTGLPTAGSVGGGECNDRDAAIWIANGGQASQPEHSNFCSRTYGGVGCMIGKDCIEACFQETYGYSQRCSSCFAVIPSCSMSNGCMMACAADSLGAKCQECNIPCIEDLRLCTGLPEVDANATIGNETDADAEAGVDEVPAPITSTGNACHDYNLKAIGKWYTVYNLTFAKSIKDAWNGDAKLLAVIIIVFSGIWPYLKNIILVIIWYTPATVERQTATILWLSRLSKYTLVDVFAVIGVLVGVQLQLNVGGTEAVTRAEPRFGIIAFFLATVWEFLQIELVKAMHERKVLGGKRPETGNRLLFSNLWIPVFLLLASVGLYISGAMLEMVYFTSVDAGNEGVCKKSYNLVTLGNALINKPSMTGNSAKGQTWILYLSYVVLNIAFPIGTHVMQACFMAGWFRSKVLKKLIEWTLAIWCFACIEVLLIGIFAVEYKFPNLIMKIAGDSNAGFLDIDSNLGVGFYVLIVYSIVAGFLQFSLRIRGEGPSGTSETGKREDVGAEAGSIQQNK